MIWQILNAKTENNYIELININKTVCQETLYKINMFMITAIFTL